MAMPLAACVLLHGTPSEPARNTVLGSNASCMDDRPREPAIGDGERGGEYTVPARVPALLFTAAAEPFEGMLRNSGAVPGRSASAARGADAHRRG
jgi:hypothetical protein